MDKLSPSEWSNPKQQRKKACLNSSESRWKALLNNDIADMTHDVTFLVGKTKTISCHKFILAAVSPVFQKMFFGKLQSPNTIIEIPDVEPHAFQNILQHAYLRILDVNTCDAATTMYAAKKYDLPDLVSYCSHILRQSIRPENVVTIYQAASVLGDPELKTRAFQFLSTNCMEILKTDGFLEFTTENLCGILKSDELIVDSELDLFDAIIRWARQKSQDTESEKDISKILVDVIKYIRFPLMDMASLLDHVEPTGVLNDKEIVLLTKYFSLPVDKRIKKDMKFNHRHRKGPELFFSINNYDYCNYSYYKSQTGRSKVMIPGEEYFLSFSLIHTRTEPNFDFYLQDVHIDCDVHDGSTQQLDLLLQVIEYPTGIELLSMIINIQNPGASNKKSVHLDKPIQIISNGFLYKAVITVIAGIIINVPPLTRQWITGQCKSIKAGVKVPDKVRFEYYSKATIISALTFSKTFDETKVTEVGSTTDTFL